MVSTINAKEEDRLPTRSAGYSCLDSSMGTDGCQAGDMAIAIPSMAAEVNDHVDFDMSCNDIPCMPVRALSGKERPISVSQLIGTSSSRDLPHDDCK